MHTDIYYHHWSGEKRPTSHELLKLSAQALRKEDVPDFTVCCDGEQGKPYIRELPQLHFSISHSGEYWVCAFSDAPLGLDLQRHTGLATPDSKQKMSNGEKLARRFFHPSEIAWLNRHGYDQFERIWACKESYVKYTGVGLRNGLDYFSVVDTLPVVQTEIPFREGYTLVLTSEQETTITLSYI